MIYSMVVKLVTKVKTTYTQMTHEKWQMALMNYRTSTSFLCKSQQNSLIQVYLRATSNTEVVTELLRFNTLLSRCLNFE